MKPTKRWKAGLTAIVFMMLQMITLLIKGISVGAADTVVYDAQEIPAFADRTIQEVSDQYSAALYAGESYVNYDSSTWYVREPSFEAPYDAGEITQDTHTTMVAMTDFFRWLMGNRPLLKESQHSEQLQAGALVRNYHFSHSVDASYKPGDMSDTLWQYGADCEHNILAGGYTPQGSIGGWMNEGYSVEYESWGTIGHRAMMMDMYLSDIQYGFSGTVAIGDTVSRENQPNAPFAAYPAPGYMPSSLVNPTTCAWSVQLDRDVMEVDDVYDVTVTITNLNTGETWTRIADDETLMSSYGCLAFVQPMDYGSGGYTDSYEVVLDGLLDAATGAAAEIRYTVKFFDITEYAMSRVDEVNFRMEYGIGPKMMNEADLKKIAAILPREIPVHAENDHIFYVPVTGDWQVDLQNSCFVNSGDVSALPERIQDYEGMLQRITIPFVQKTGYTAEYDTLDIIPSQVDSGSRVSLSVYRTNISTDTVHIFKLRQKADGSYTAVKTFDSADYEDGSEEVQEGYVIESACAADGGEYLSVYFNQSWIDGGYTVSVFVSNMVSTLKVKGTLAGDLNQDGVLDGRDLILMAKGLTGMADIPLDAADCNGDGHVNIFDMVVLKAQLHDAGV
ncbi:MAG: dockerin type I domain-containing protein [Ruminococcus sp.]